MAPAFSRILLACDNSAGSRMALRYACQLAESEAALAVTHAVRESNFIASAAAAGAFPPIDPKPMMDAVDESGDSVLKAAVDACAALGVAAKKVFAHGAPSDAVVAVARQIDAELIVVGTHGRKGIGRAFHGSVAEGIVRASDIPVLVITQHTKAPRSEALFRRALVAIDESDPSTAALATAGKLAIGCGTRLILCNVVDSSDADFGPDDEDTIDRDVPGAVAFLLERAAAVKEIAPFLDDEIVIEGEPADAIEHAAMQRNCDIIIVGSHGRRGLRRLWDGSVAETVARSSALPVLVVPRQPGAAGADGRNARRHETRDDRLTSG
jgi:nucleotide-binding universal stress UspA family protein